MRKRKRKALNLRWQKLLSMEDTRNVWQSMVCYVETHNETKRNETSMMMVVYKLRASHKRWEEKRKKTYDIRRGWFNIGGGNKFERSKKHLETHLESSKSGWKIIYRKEWREIHFQPLLKPLTSPFNTRARAPSSTSTYLTRETNDKHNRLKYHHHCRLRELVCASVCGMNCIDTTES